MLGGVLNGLYRLCGLLAALSLVGICSLVLAQVVGRFAGFAVLSANEMAGYLVLASTFLALAPALRSGTHIRVRLVVERLPLSLQRAAEMVTLVLAAGLAVYATVWVVDLVQDSIAFGEVSPGRLAIPLAIPQGAMAVGLGVFVIALLHCLVEVVRGETPAYARGQGMMED